MAVPAGSHRLGPDNASLLVHTYRQGMASKAGHDLILEVTTWECNVEGDGGSARVELTADPGSLVVREGVHGVKPLTDKDRGDIEKNIERKVLGATPIAFRSSAIEPSVDRGTLTLEGELEMAGQSRPLSFGLQSGADGRVEAAITLTPSDWGIKPYSALMGALKVKDDIEVRLAAELSPRS